MCMAQTDFGLEGRVAFFEREGVAVWQLDKAFTDTWI